LPCLCRRAREWAAFRQDGPIPSRIGLIDLQHDSVLLLVIAVLFFVTIVYMTGSAFNPFIYFVF
jgi:hypothetical protein